MGGGNWSTDTYAKTTRSAIDKGTNFAHDRHVRSTGDYKVHESLDPKSVNKNGSHEGQNIREAYDNDEHPESNAIVVVFDVTGSMHRIPRILQQKLPPLHGLLLRKGYISDPQIMFGAFGDATSDRLPLQIGQFESDNRMDENLENLVLEGGGGGQIRESSELALYFAARHTDIDCLNKRGKKGYMFLITDEMAYDNVAPQHIVDVIGGGAQESIPLKEIVGEVQDKYELFVLYAESGSYPTHQDEIFNFWRDLVGERVIRLSDFDAVSETIGLTIGLTEGTVDLDTGLADLKDVGADLATIETVGKTLATVGGATDSGLATASGSVPDADSGTGATRL